MKMPPNVALWFQQKLYLLTLSGYNPDLFTCAKPGELNDDRNFRWQFAVDMIYRGIQCGLIDVWDGAKKQRGTLESSLELVEKIAQFNPDVDPNADPHPDSMCWFADEIEATDLCKALTKKFDIPNVDWDVICEPFIEEIEAMFDHHGVSWSDAPLIELGSGASRAEH